MSSSSCLANSIKITDPPTTTSFYFSEKDLGIDIFESNIIQYKSHQCNSIDKNTSIFPKTLNVQLGFEPKASDWPYPEIPSNVGIDGYLDTGKFAKFSADEKDNQVLMYGRLFNGSKDFEYGMQYQYPDSEACLTREIKYFDKSGHPGSSRNIEMTIYPCWSVYEKVLWGADPSYNSLRPFTIYKCDK